MPYSYDAPNAPFYRLWTYGRQIYGLRLVVAHVAVDIPDFDRGFLLVNMVKGSFARMLVRASRFLASDLCGRAGRHRGKQSNLKSVKNGATIPYGRCLR